MPSVDLPEGQLRSYRTTETEPADFEEFWGSTVAEARQVPLDIELGPATPALAHVQANQIWFGGYAGARISGWYVRPDGAGPWPGLVYYHGYGSRAARPLELYALAAQGIAVLSMDCRGQGGDSPDIPPVDGGHHAGWLTRGLRDPATHYYRFVFADTVRAIDALAGLAEVDESRLATTGASQGGALSLAAAALSGRAKFVWSDIPFLCDFPRSVAITPAAPYTEIATYLRRHPALYETAFKSLAYFDIANHARRVSCPAKVTVGLWDDVCPPSGIFGMFARLPSEDTELIVMPYHGHEVLYDQDERRFSELVQRLGAAPPA
jgi:cephalosporin-C deacetylase